MQSQTLNMNRNGCTTIRPYKVLLLTCVVNCTADTPMPRLCPVVQWSVHWTPSRTTRVLVLAGARRCALETCEKKNMWAPLLGLARSIYYIAYYLQSNWNTRRENWCKIKEMDCRRKHKCQRQCQLRMIPPRKILPFYSHVSMTTVKNCNRENINSLVFLELQHITFLYSFLIGFSHI